MDLVLYLHGKGGSAAEAAHYAPLFPDCEVRGLDYRSVTPRAAGAEIRAAAEALKAVHDRVILIANSIGAYFSMHARLDTLAARAYFISPIVNMEQLILDMLARTGATEEALRAHGVIHTAFGEDLSWEYLCDVRAHPPAWNAPTAILYGENDALTARRTMEAFAKAHGAALTVMKNGEHWFHTDEQMRFLDDWILKAEAKER